MSKIWIPDLPIIDLLIRVTVVYVCIILLLRLSGKRQVAQMGIPQFVALLLISNAVQNAMNGGDNSLTGGLILAAALILLSYLLEWVTYRWGRVERFIQGRPTLLIHHGDILHGHLRHELLNPSELRTLLRRQNIHNLAEIEEAVLEPDGYISIVKKSEVEPPMQAGNSHAC